MDEEMVKTEDGETPRSRESSSFLAPWRPDEGRFRN